MSKCKEVHFLNILIFSETNRVVKMFQQWDYRISEDAEFIIEGTELK